MDDYGVLGIYLLFVLLFFALAAKDLEVHKFHEVERQMILLDNAYRTTRNGDQKAYIYYEETKLRDTWADMYKSRKWFSEHFPFSIVFSKIPISADTITNLFNSLDVVNDFNKEEQ